MTHQTPWLESTGEYLGNRGHLVGIALKEEAHATLVLARTKA